MKNSTLIIFIIRLLIYSFNVNYSIDEYASLEKKKIRIIFISLIIGGCDYVVL